MRSAPRLAAFVLAGLALSACQSASERSLRKSPDFKAGYFDGCATAGGQGANMRETGKARDEQAYRANRAYSVGWDTGFNSCRNTQSSAGAPSLPGQGPIRDPGTSPF